MVALLTAVTMTLPAATIAKDNDNKGHDQREARMLGSTLEVHINDDGKVLVRGAKVTAINGNAISATTSWGNALLTWTVNVDGNTEFIPRSGGAVNLGEVAVGDTVSFQGQLATASGGLVVNAKVVKDWSIVAAQNQPRVFEGTLKSLAGTTVPTSMVLTVGNVDYTVNIAANISVLNNLWLTTSLANFRVGDRVRVYGALSGTTINASVVRDTSIRL